jgi:hypothetical protein
LAMVRRGAKSRAEGKPCSSRRLTLPSSGHATAGFAVCGMPLMSNVRPRAIRMRSMSHTVELCRTAAAEGNSLHRCVEQHTRCIGVGRPSAGGRRTRSSTPSSLAASARAVRPSAASTLSVRLGRRQYACASSNAVSSLRQRVNTTNTQPGVPSVMPRSCSSLALRSTAAPGCSGRAGTGFARAGGVGALGHGISQREIQTGQAVSSPARSNPSVKRTHNGGAQLRAPSALAAPSCAAYLKR